MSSKPSPAPKAEILMTGVAMGESPRWHENRLWFSDWGAQEILAIDSNGKSEVVVPVPFGFPFCIDWLLDGRLLVVSGYAGLLLRRERDGSLVTHADLHGPAGMGWNEIVVDGRGNVYINGGAGITVLTSDGLLRQVADSIAFPNGMAITPDNSTLIIAESYGKKLTAFDIAADGSLSKRRVWADLGDGVPDGICIDAENAVWYADVPNKRCVRVREGGEILQTVKSELGCFACALGGPSGATLFVVTREWRGVESTTDRTRTGRVITVNAPAPHAGWP